MQLRGKEKTAADLYDDLVDVINTVVADIKEHGRINKKAHPDEFLLFDNSKRVIDGPWYVYS